MSEFRTLFPGIGHEVLVTFSAIIQSSFTEISGLYNIYFAFKIVFRYCIEKV